MKHVSDKRFGENQNTVLCSITFFPENRAVYEIIIIIIISTLSNDRSKASSKTIPPHSAI